MNKKIMALLSIVELDKGKKLIKELKDKQIPLNFQTVGFGTAPTEMMEIFGIGSKNKDVIISLGGESAVRDMMASSATAFSGQSKYGGLMIVLDISAASRILTEVLNFSVGKNTDKGSEAMKNESQNHLIVISVNDGYTEAVMHVARKAGAAGGTILKGRLTDAGQFAEFVNTQVDSEREILFILAPKKVSKQIMEDVNQEFGITSPANGILFAVPVEKAHKI